MGAAVSRCVRRNRPCPERHGLLLTEPMLQHYGIHDEIAKIEPITRYGYTSLSGCDMVALVHYGAKAGDATDHHFRKWYTGHRNGTLLMVDKHIHRRAFVFY